MVNLLWLALKFPIFNHSDFTITFDEFFPRYADPKDHIDKNKVRQQLQVKCSD